MKRWVVVLSFSLVLLLLGLPIGCDLAGGGVEEPAKVIGGKAGPEKERRAALAFATRFVEALDRGERIAPMMARFLREQTTDDALETMFNGFRSWTGPFVKRSAFAYGYSESLPELPPGRYFTVLYRSHFERGNVEEKVIVSVDEAGESVAGYFQSKRINYAKPGSGPPAGLERTPPGTMTR